MTGPTVEQRRAYAERSMTWEHGQKTEDELLQRIWNLAGDVASLAAALSALQARANAWPDELHTQYLAVLDERDALQARVEAAERERDEARKAIYDRDEYGRKTGCDCHEHSTGDPDYTPAYQDEYQRLWHEAAARAQRLESALEDTNELLVRVAKWIQEPDIPPTEMSRYVASRWASARAALADTPKEGTP